MNKRVFLVILSIPFLIIGLSILQYTRELRTEQASAAYSTSKPANGHSWSEMECTSNLCVTGENIGIGTDSPTTKLQVSGTVKATDVCNEAGICLSAFASVTNACGPAAKAYTATDTTFSGDYCYLGTPNPATPAFPAQGGSTTWTCPMVSTPVSCTATRALPVNGACGTANGKTYTMLVSSYGSDTICTSGTYSTPAFPSQSSPTISWTCAGSGGGTSANCSASVKSCSAAGGTVYSCGASGTCCMFSGSNVSCPSGWSQLGNWSTTVTNPGGTNSGVCCNGECTCQILCNAACPEVPGHAWGNAPQESCQQTCFYSSCWCDYHPRYFYANRTQIGCY